MTPAARSGLGVGSLALIVLASVSAPVPLAAQERDDCLILCAPELNFEPTLTLENLFARPRVAVLQGGVVRDTTRLGRESAFEAILAVDVPTEIPRVGRSGGRGAPLAAEGELAAQSGGGGIPRLSGHRSAPPRGRNRQPAVPRGRERVVLLRAARHPTRAAGSGRLLIEARSARLSFPFAAGATEPESYTDRVPVRLGDRVVGEIELARIFDWPG